MISAMRRLLTDLFRLFFPPLCSLCRRRLAEGEEKLCLHCVDSLPCTSYLTLRQTPLLWNFAAAPNVVAATAFLHYDEDTPAKQLIYDLKYHGDQDIGRFLGRLAGHRLLASDSPLCAATLIVPVPLYPARQRRRGYNQSVCIAEGLAAAMHIPMADETAFVRIVDTSSQTKKDAAARRRNVSGAFVVARPEAFAGHRQVLLVDDVSTTESTLSACVEAFATTLPEVRLSLFALAKTTLL
jgi:ComF family protein